eukprot:c18659_g1_i4.p1 GENE.c18659_g1_i4~~c18659_g1_i4.p1  ORF type:complete len:207 (+),score=32.90 c18659_g1_i4:103-723(+)
METWLEEDFGDHQHWQTKKFGHTQPTFSPFMNGSQKGKTPMQWVAISGKSERISVLQDFGSDVNGASSSGTTPMHVAATHGYAEMVQVLHELGGDVNKAVNITKNSSEQYGWTPMAYAAMFGHVEVVQALCRLGGDANKATNDGRTPLIQACIEGHVAQALIGFGANVSVEDENCMNARGNRSTQRSCPSLTRKCGADCEHFCSAH